jgi:hypothetical protein
MASLGQIDANVEANASTGGSGSVTIIPEDVYELEIFESDVKLNSTGKGQNLDYKVRVASGPHKGVWWFDGITSIQHESAQAQQIAQGQLRALAQACDLPWPLQSGDSDQFHFRPFHAQVGIETYFSRKHQKEMSKNKIVKYLFDGVEPDPIPEGKPPASAAPQSPPPPPPSSSAGGRSWQRRT